MVTVDTIRRFLALGKWVLLATHIWFCVLLTLIFALAVYLTATGGVRLQLSEPWDSISFYAVVAPHIVVCICWGLFCLLFLILYRRVLGAGTIQQIVSMAAIAVPFWGGRYYNRLAMKIIEIRTAESI